MSESRPFRIVLGFVFLLGLGLGLAITFSPRVQFVLGGALVNVGYRMQDRLHAFDLSHEHALSPTQVLTELTRQNELSALVRAAFPRSTEHPTVALLVCMDARIDTSELVGDTRHYYYIVRTAGSVLGVEEQEMLELAVLKGVEVVVLTTHSDCAAEKVAHDPVQAQAFPALSRLVGERERRIQEFLSRPLIKQRIAEGKLRVERMFIDTATERLLPAAPVEATVPLVER